VNLTNFFSIFNRIDSDIYLLILLICGISNVWISYKHKLPFHLKIFAFLNLITFISEFTAKFFAYYFHNNWKILNCFILIETVWHLWFFYLIIKLSAYKKSIPFIMVGYFLFWCYCNVFIVNFFKKGDSIWNSYSVILSSVLTISLCVVYLYQLIEVENVFPLTKHTEFIIVFAMLIFYTCQIPYFGTLNYLKNHHLMSAKTYLMDLHTLELILNDIMYSLFIYAYVCKTSLMKSR
jgi:hypothetical protein